MNFALDVLYSSLQEFFSTLLGSVFLVPLNIVSEIIIRFFTGAS